MATIKIEQIRSRIHTPKDQKGTLDALGLHKMHQQVEIVDNECTRGMIRKVSHLIKVIE
ncbi:MAG: 50S ribosomal protein L30 [Alloprevotella sp.]|nr:50S ribosomal protein L30 [Prevotella sp.]MBR1387299.1 50S ribosomal protein L30 [Alloprevotella sp.]